MPVIPRFLLSAAAVQAPRHRYISQDCPCGKVLGRVAPPAPRLNGRARHLVALCTALAIVRVNQIAVLRSRRSVVGAFSEPIFFRAVRAAFCVQLASRHICDPELAPATVLLLALSELLRALPQSNVHSGQGMFTPNVRYAPELPLINDVPAEHYIERA